MAVSPPKPDCHTFVSYFQVFQDLPFRAFLANVSSEDLAALLI